MILVYIVRSITLGDQRQNMSLRNTGQLPVKAALVNHLMKNQTALVPTDVPQYHIIR